MLHHLRPTYTEIAGLPKDYYQRFVDMLPEEGVPKSALEVEDYVCMLEERFLAICVDKTWKGIWKGESGNKGHIIAKLHWDLLLALLSKQNVGCKFQARTSQQHVITDCAYLGSLAQDGSERPDRNPPAQQTEVDDDVKPIIPTEDEERSAAEQIDNDKTERAKSKKSVAKGTCRKRYQDYCA